MAGRVDSVMRWPGGGIISPGNHTAHASRATAHDREWFTTPCGSKVFVIMETHCENCFYHDHEWFSVCLG
jgi:hypothetical protein